MQYLMFLGCIAFCLWLLDLSGKKDKMQMAQQPKTQHSVSSGDPHPWTVVFVVLLVIVVVVVVVHH